jgi:hypothetical protein
MKKLCLLAFVAMMFLSLALPARADEPAKYNFASAQGGKELAIPSGREGVGDIYFYNIDGNRITHVVLELDGTPSGWDVSIEPALTKTQVLVSGVPVTVEENLYVEPSELLPEEPQDVPQGMISVMVPGRGYALGKQARVVIHVPETTPPGTIENIIVSAEASWLGQSGSAAIKQAKNFEFTVNVISGTTGYTETIVNPEEEPVVQVPAGKTSAEAATGDTAPVQESLADTVVPMQESSTDTAAPMQEQVTGAVAGESGAQIPVWVWIIIAGLVATIFIIFITLRRNR